MRRLQRIARTEGVRHVLGMDGPGNRRTTPVHRGGMPRGALCAGALADGWTGREGGQTEGRGEAAWEGIYRLSGQVRSLQNLQLQGYLGTFVLF